MAEPLFDNQDPLWPSKAHFEEKTNFGHPRCQAWKSNRSAQCGKNALKGLRVCEFHGGQGVLNNRRLMDRRDFMEALADHTGEDGDHITPEIISKLAELAKKGNLDAIKYWLDQQFGPAKQRLDVTSADQQIGGIDDLGRRAILAAAEELAREGK